MANNTAKISPNRYARVAGLLYLSLIPLGVFGILYVPSMVIIPGDIAATASNITANELLFRLSIVSVLLSQLVNIILALLLYKSLKPVNKGYAALMVIFLVLAVPIAFLNELTKFAALLILSGSEYSTIFTTDQLQALAYLFLDLHELGISIAGIFWALWLVPMGYLVYMSGFLPRIIGVLLVIAAVGYLLDDLILFLSLPNAGVEFAAFAFIGEGLMALWLLVKGVNVEKWEERTLESP